MKKNITKQKWEQLFDLKFPMLNDENCGIKKFIRQYVVPEVELNASIKQLKECGKIVSRTFRGKKK